MPLQMISRSRNVIGGDWGAEIDLGPPRDSNERRGRFQVCLCDPIGGEREPEISLRALQQKDEKMVQLLRCQGAETGMDWYGGVGKMWDLKAPHRAAVCAMCYHAMWNDAHLNFLLASTRVSKILSQNFIMYLIFQYNFLLSKKFKSRGQNTCQYPQHCSMGMRYCTGIPNAVPYPYPLNPRPDNRGFTRTRDKPYTSLTQMSGRSLCTFSMVLMNQHWQMSSLKNIFRAKLYTSVNNKLKSCMR